MTDARAATAVAPAEASSPQGEGPSEVSASQTAYSDGVTASGVRITPATEEVVVLDYGGQYSQSDRPADPRLRRIQRAAAPPRPARGDRQAQTARDHPVRRARVGVRGRRARARHRPPGAGRAGDGHLLRHAVCSSTPSAGGWSRRRWASSGARTCTCPTGARCCGECPTSRPAGCHTGTPCSSRPPASAPWPPRAPRRWPPSRTPPAASTASSSIPRSSTPPTARRSSRAF